MQARIIHYGPWQIPIRCEHCLCPDGKRRNVKITGQPDTYFTIPAKLSYRGTSVTGTVMHCRLSTCTMCGHNGKDEYTLNCPNCGVDIVGHVEEQDDLEFVPTGKNSEIFGK